ncbi:MAG: hypothetical protein ACP6IU_12550 [Candidatus Asgardarchaeia archaeon]
MSKKIFIGTIALNTFAVFIIAILRYYADLAAYNDNIAQVIQNHNLILLFVVLALLINTGIISYLARVSK